MKIIWNFMKHWDGDGSNTEWSYTYWDRGEQLPLYYEGASKTIFLTHRVEPQYQESGGDIFKNEKRQSSFETMAREDLTWWGIGFLRKKARFRLMSREVFSKSNFRNIWCPRPG